MEDWKTEKLENQIYLNSYLSKLLKQNFGKGPEACFSTFSNNIVLFQIKKFKTPIEEILLIKGEMDIAKVVRHKVVEVIFDNIQEVIFEKLGIKVEKFYHDWDYNANIGAIIGICKNINNELNDFESLKLEIMRYNPSFHANFSQMTLHYIGANAILVQLSNIYLTVEKTLKEKSYYNLLREIEYQIIGNYRKNKMQFEKLFSRKMDNLYAFWDYECDSSFILFIFN